MDTLIAVVLIIIAFCMLRGKPFKIEVKHEYPQQTQPDVTNPKAEDEPDNFDDVTSAIQRLNNIMTGGDPDAR